MDKLLLIFLFLLTRALDAQTVMSGIADPCFYLNDLKKELQIEWPENRIINIVFHGHSVPSGYFKTPLVNTFEAYPNLLLKKLKVEYSFSVVNSNVNAKGGENSLKGADRFEREVLIHKPDVLFIDYALNDRSIGLEKAYQAWDEMIRKAKVQGISVILLSPSPDLKVDFADPNNELKKHADQIRHLDEENQVGFSDSYKAFECLYPDKEKLSKFMSQFNHSNELGHDLIDKKI